MPMDLNTVLHHSFHIYKHGEAPLQALARTCITSKGGCLEVTELRQTHHSNWKGRAGNRGGARTVCACSDLPDAGCGLPVAVRGCGLASQPDRQRQCLTPDTYATHVSALASDGLCHAVHAVRGWSPGIFHTRWHAASDAYVFRLSSRCWLSPTGWSTCCGTVVFACWSPACRST